MLPRASIGSFPNLTLPESGHVDLDWIAVSVLMQAELLGLVRRMNAPRRHGWQNDETCHGLRRSTWLSKVPLFFF